MRPYHRLSRNNLQSVISGNRLLGCNASLPFVERWVPVLPDSLCRSSVLTRVLSGLTVESLCSILTNWKSSLNFWMKIEIFCISPFGSSGVFCFLLEASSVQARLCLARKWYLSSSGVINENDGDSGNAQASSANLPFSLVISSWSFKFLQTNNATGRTKRAEPEACRVMAFMKGDDCVLARSCVREFPPRNASVHFQ